MSHWREDLVQYSRSPTVVGALLAWFFSPGFRVMTAWRFAKAMSTKAKPLKLLGRLAEVLVIERSGCYISTKAEIGRRLFLPHPTAIVIGEGVTIGDDCTIYQSTTFGRAKVDDETYPHVCDGVIVYAGSVIVGAINLGTSAIVGANSVVLDNVPAGSVVAGCPARIIGK